MPRWQVPGLGNNIRAQNEARTAVDMEPGNYEYQNLLDRLQNPGRAYSTYQQAYTQPGSRQHGMNFCLQAWLYLMLCNLCSICCCGGARWILYLLNRGLK